MPDNSGGGDVAGTCRPADDRRGSVNVLKAASRDRGSTPRASTDAAKQRSAINQIIEKMENLPQLITDAEAIFADAQELAKSYPEVQKLVTDIEKLVTDLKAVPPQGA